MTYLFLQAECLAPPLAAGLLRRLPLQRCHQACSRPRIQRSRIPRAAARKPISYAKRRLPPKSSQQLRGETRNNEPPEPSPDAALEVTVLGGGLAGLFVALLVASTLRGRKRVRVLDSRWRVNEGKLAWQEGSCTARVLSLQSVAWSALPEELRRLLEESGFGQWPLQRESPGRCGHPLNVCSEALHQRLLDVAQEEPYASCIELLPIDTGTAACRAALEADAFHTLVLADGPDALQARAELFGEHFPAALQPRELACCGALGVAFEAPVNVAASTALSLAQRRFALSAASSEKGVMSIVLAESEVDAAETLISEKRPENAMGSLKEAIREGFQLFGVPESAATELLRLQPRLQGQQEYFAELQQWEAPEAECAWLPKPWAFVVGEAAEIDNSWPGRAGNASLKGSMALVRQLRAIAEAVRAGYRVDRDFCKEYGQQMVLLQALEAGVHQRQAQAAGSLGQRLEASASAPGGAEDAAEHAEAFLQAVRKSLARLDGKLPPERLEELPTEEMLCKHVEAVGLSRQTLRFFQASGAWFPDPPSAEDVQAEAMSQSSDSTPEMEAGKQAEARTEFNLGVRLLKGRGTPPNEVEAARCFRRAAELGHKEAAYALGVMLLKGKGTEKDEAAAAHWFQAAANQGHAKASYNLGLMYQHGVGVEMDFRQAKFMTGAAAELGHMKALRSGAISVFGVGPWMDYDPKSEGVDSILKKAKEHGDMYAQHKLGMMYSEGDCVEMDKAQASYWFMQAAQGGLSEAQYQVSRMLFLGDGVEKDEEYAFRFLTMAAEKGHPESMHNLGCKLYFGEGIPIDRRTAASWFLKASEKGFPQSMNNIGWMLYTGDSIPQNVKEGKKWLEKAADAGNEEAQMHLACTRGGMMKM